MHTRVRAVIVAVAAALIPGVFSQTAGGAIKSVHVSGRITDETGAPISNATLKCTNADHREDLRTTTDTDGKFAFTVAVLKEYGIYRIEPAVSPTFTDIGKIVAAGVSEIDLGTLVLGFNNRHEPLVKLQGPVTISGTSATSQPSPWIAAIFVAAGGAATIIDDGGKIFSPPKETDQVDYTSPQISEDRRSVGWSADFPFCCTSYPISLALVVYRPGQPVRRFTGDGRAIFVWRFVAGGKEVAFYQDFLHGIPAQHYELRDIETGRLIGQWDGELTAEAPQWTTGLR